MNRTSHQRPAEYAAAPGLALLPEQERALFVQAFRKELDFLELLLLLVNRTFPFNNVDLIWAGAAASGRVTLWQGTGTTRALRNPRLRSIDRRRANPNPRFCNLIHDYGRREAETCLLSDLAAAARARRSGRIQVYTCHAGITDIAAPVQSGAHYLATLHCGQCLRTPPSPEGFARIARRVQRLKHVNLAALHEAYYQLAVIPPREIRRATQALALLAESLGRLWERLRDTVRFAAIYRRGRQTAPLLREEVTELCRALSAQRWEESALRLRVLPGLARRQAGPAPESLPALRELLLWALELERHTVQRMGCTEAELAPLGEEAKAELHQARTPGELEAAYGRWAERLLEEARRLYAGKHEKLVARAQRLIEIGVEHPESAARLSLESVAASLGVSAGHLSRLFSRLGGTSFRRYLTARRLERARRLLLDPVNNIAQVAEACGFASPAYFARVFRKAMGCSPGEYARRPSARRS